MAGSATLTTVASSSAIPEPRTAAAISHRAPADANGSWRGSTDSPATSPSQPCVGPTPWASRKIDAEPTPPRERRLVARALARVHAADVNFALAVQTSLP